MKQLVSCFTAEAASELFPLIKLTCCGFLHTKAAVCRYELLRILDGWSNYKWTNCFNGTCHCLFCFAFFFFVRTWRECSSSGPAHLELEDEVGHEDPGQGHQEPPAHNTQRIWCRKYDPRRTCRRGMLTSVPACGPVIISCVLCPVFTYIQVQIY